MNTQPKPRGTTGAVPELTRLKLLWRDSLDASAQDHWRSLFASTSTQAQLRAQLKAELGIRLNQDNQLTSFRSWLERQDAMDEEAQLQQEEEIKLRTAHPDWDADRLRSEVIAASMRRAIATGDFSGLGLKAVKAGQNEKVIALDTEKFKESIRTKLESGLAELAQHIQGNAQAQAAYEAFKLTLAESTK
jgi:hypothetical protein